MGQIDIKNVHRGATAGSYANKTGPVPHEVPVPALSAWVEKYNNSASNCVPAAQIA